MEEKNSSFRQEGNQLIYTRILDAPRELVWEVWTKPEHIEKWWGPDGFTLSNSSMDVSVGKQWKFLMHGFGHTYDNKVNYLEVVEPSLLVYQHGDDNDEISFRVHVSFEELSDKTFLTMRSVFASEEIIAKLNKEINAVESGKQTLNKMVAYIQAQTKTRQQLKRNHMARVSTYLNFPGNTEEAFNFYKSVFGGEFTGHGIQRFGDLPPMEGAPALPEADKNLILHIELTILGGHVLMATDAPASMGFTVVPGNNVYINIEPDSREETKRLFETLSAGGKVSMDLADMFWGAYYGSFADKFGINWMVNYTQDKTVA